MATYGDIQQAIKELDKGIVEVQFRDMHDFLIEEMVNRKGRYSAKLSFDAKEIIKNPNGVPRSKADYKWILYLVLMRQNIKHKTPKKKSAVLRE